MSLYRTRISIVFSLMGLLAAARAATGCQNIIGISGLDVTGGTGGSGVENECSPMVCDDGDCERVDAPAGTPCGGTCVGVKYTAPGTCDGSGLCSSLPVSCEPHFACNEDGVTCNTTCDISGGCAPDGVCIVLAQVCEECGEIPPLGPCPGTLTGCDSCSNGECLMTCNAPGKCDKNRSFDGMGLPVRLECNDQCNDITISTFGTAPTEVVCTSGCNGLTLSCAVDGLCTLTCNGTGCVGAKVLCGGNSCIVACNGGPVAVEQTCGIACSCSKVGCE